MWLVYGAWAWLIVSSLVIFNTRGDVAAANHALPGTVLVLLLHGGVWLYKKNKRPTRIQRHATKPAAPSIDDSIYDQIASEMSSGHINGGLMARAIAEADGDKDRTQALYIKLRAAAIAKEREQARYDAADKEANARKAQAEEDAKAFVNAQKSMSDSRTEFVKGMVRADLKDHNDEIITKILLGILIALAFGASIYAVMFSDSSASKISKQVQTVQHEYTELAKVHPDYEQIAKDPAFHEWIKTQPAGVHRLYESASAQDSIALLHMYKRAKAN